jgi:hypothetical protein
MKTGMAAIAVALAMALIACTDPGAWDPVGAAELVSTYESKGLGDTMKSCELAFRISNRGRSRIASSSISFSLETDARVYYRTTVSELVVPPGSSAFVEATVVYDSGAEAMKPGGAKIVDQFYE